LFLLINISRHNQDQSRNPLKIKPLDHWVTETSPKMLCILNIPPRTHNVQHNCMGN